MKIYLNICAKMYTKETSIYHELELDSQTG